MQSRWHPDDFDSDPIVEASEHHKAGDLAGAHETLMKLLAEDRDPHTDALEPHGKRQPLAARDLWLSVAAATRFDHRDRVTP